MGRQEGAGGELQATAAPIGRSAPYVLLLTSDLPHKCVALLQVADDDNMELAAALWKGAFRESEGADTEAVLRLADYVRRETLSLLLQPREDVYRGWITWGPALGEAPEDRLARQARMLEGEWREALHPDGRVFFYHTATHERRWDAPPQGLYTRRRFALRRFFESAPGGDPLLAGASGQDAIDAGGKAAAEKQ